MAIRRHGLALTATRARMPSFRLAFSSISSTILRHTLVRWFAFSNIRMKSYGNYPSAWYEWYPAEVFYFDDITIDEGDQIWAQVVATSPTTGKAVIKNLSKGQSVEKELSSAYPLCGANAEWIVEDFSYDNGTLVPLNDFGSVTFYDAFALTTDPEEEIISPYNATIILLEQNNKTITCVHEEELKVTISYDATVTR